MRMLYENCFSPLLATCYYECPGKPGGTEKLNITHQIVRVLILLEHLVYIPC